MTEKKSPRQKRPQALIEKRAMNIPKVRIHKKSKKSKDNGFRRI